MDANYFGPFIDPNDLPNGDEAVKNPYNTSRPGEYRSPLAPNADEATDPRAYQDNLSLDVREPVMGMSVPKNNARNSMADPSVGTAAIRPAALERTGARYRVHPIFGAPPNEPYSAANQANGRVVPQAPGTDPGGKDWGPGVGVAFEDAEAIAGRAPGSSRMRGYTARNG